MGMMLAMGPGMVAPKTLAQKVTVEDDLEAYLVAFERLDTTAAWPREYWASQLGPCLIGEAQTAYRVMTDDDAAQYNLVKQAILCHFNIMGETHRVRFQESRRPSNTRPRAVAQQLRNHMAQWLNLSQKTGVQMGEAIVMEQFCHVVGAETQAWIRRHNPTTLDQAMALAETFEDARMSAQTTLLNCPLPRDHHQHPPGPRPARQPTLSGHLPPLPWRQRLAPSWGRVVSPAQLSYQQRDKYVPPLLSAPPVCFSCQQPGHIGSYCPAAMECDLAACHLASETGKKWGNGWDGQCIVDVMLGNVKTHALVDTV
ncbi:zinc finger protein 444-like [Polyodon spathula]|uniref:zinc finger protein 444-like n=1 Tax=Polyodon spathula TaxID=7913 RepID=UPI001B7E6B99|nr:zinc finger protein 444-like [Polyodon spathula]